MSAESAPDPTSQLPTSALRGDREAV